jgi:hypothetical protein
MTRVPTMAVKVTSAVTLTASQPTAMWPACVCEFLDAELQTHAEHQQDHSDLCQLFGEGCIRHETRRVGTDDRACQQVPDDRRQAETLRDCECYF